ncbi:MAG: cytochrome-c peroxidase, partial [Phycisphaerae bacterium]
ACHSGPNFTDGVFHTVRVPPRGNEAVSDAGRYEGIHLLMKDDFRASGAHSDERDGAASKKLERLRQSAELWGLFKTPSLRNVALTAPYMHQGQFATLPEVLHHYSTFENALPPGHHEQEITLQPLQLTEQETADLLAFLQSLTGKKAGEIATKVRPTD